MSKGRRGGYVFMSWKGDHEPRHVHVFQDGRLILKWNLVHGKVISGRPTRRLVDLINRMVAWGVL
jgi:hypothetical protein